MKDGIKPIETWHGGKLYRSRLEARWAVFLDILNEPFSYELEGFELQPIPANSEPPLETAYANDRPLWYVPDFWLPRVQQWIEIKPEGKPEPIEIEKAKRLMYWHASRTYIVTGSPERYKAMAMNPLEVDAFWCGCVFCGAIGLAVRGLSTNLTCCKENEQRDKNGAGSKIYDAIQVAADYRFDWTRNPDHIFLNRQQ